MDCANLRMERLQKARQQMNRPIIRPSYYLPSEPTKEIEPEPEPYHDQMKNKTKKIIVDDLEYDELINTIIKRKPNINITRKILKRYADEAECEESDE